MNKKLTELFSSCSRVNSDLSQTLFMNTIQQQTRPKNHGMTPDHNKSGIYKLKCKTCNKAYIGQTSRNLSLRFREHIRYIKNNDPPISLCTAYPTKHPRIWHPCRHYDTIKTIARHHQTNPIWTAVHPNIPPQRRSHRRTVRHWTQPIIPVDDMQLTPHTTQQPINT